MSVLRNVHRRAPACNAGASPLLATFPISPDAMRPSMDSGTSVYTVPVVLKFVSPSLCAYRYGRPGRLCVRGRRLQRF